METGNGSKASWRNVGAYQSFMSLNDMEDTELGVPAERLFYELLCHVQVRFGLDRERERETKTPTP